MRGTWVVAALCAMAVSGCGVSSTIQQPPAPAQVSVQSTPVAGTPVETTAAPAPRTPALPPSARPTAAPVKTPYTVRGIELVNRQHPIASSYVPPWGAGLKPELQAALKEMYAAAKKDGYTLKLRSGYRSYATQKASYQNALAQYDEVTANRYFAPPGTSEHQTGLAADVTNQDGVRGYDFKELPEATWIEEHAHEFGLIVRYPEVGEPITQIAWEPWHVRWVGKEVAAEMARTPGLTLEEYLGEA